MYKVEKREENKENAKPKQKEIKNRKMNKSKMRKLTSMVMRDNPITQRDMAKRLEVSQFAIYDNIRQTLKMKVEHKRLVHRLSPLNIFNRLERGPDFKQIVTENKLKLFTVDESMFPLQLGGGKRNLSYVPIEKPSQDSSDTISDNSSNNLHYEREERFSPTVMV